MIKSELVSLIASRNPHLYHADAEKIVEAVLEEIAVTLCDGGRVVSATNIPPFLL